MASGFKFTDNSVSYDMSDLFVKKEYFNEGGLYAFGFNSSGELGLGDTTSRSSPVQVGSNKNWKFVSKNTDRYSGISSTFLINSNSELFAFGYNNHGILGLGDETNRSSPVQVGTDKNWKSACAGQDHALFLKTDGTLWSSGYNPFGELGINNTTHKSSPVQIGSLTDWKRISAGISGSFAIRDNGTLWAWGYNAFGDLCVGDTTNRSSPVQVGTDVDWTEVKTQLSDNGTFALKANGALYYLSGNNVSPIQSSYGVGWKQATVSYLSYFGVRKDGTLWAWGYNYNGELGLNNSFASTGIITYTSPIQVGLLNNWKYVSVTTDRNTFGGEISVYAVKTDGSLWGWGDNSSGQLCDGTTTFRSSPIRIGNLNNWKTVEGSNLGAFAIQDNISTF